MSALTEAMSHAAQFKLQFYLAPVMVLENGGLYEMKIFVYFEKLEHWYVYRIRVQLISIMWNAWLVEGEVTTTQDRVQVYVLNKS